MKIGCVPYGHAKPLAGAWKGTEPVWAHPKELARRLWAGEMDLALVPVWEVLSRSAVRVLDGVAIGSRGEVRSVGVFHSQPLVDCKTIEVTPHSATSVQLWKLVAEHMGISLTKKRPADARLLIGDVALEEWNRTNGLGVLDLGSAEVESPQTVAARIRAGLRHVAAERLVIAPDCGMKYLPRARAFGKLSAMAAGAAMVRYELAGG